MGRLIRGWAVFALSVLVAGCAVLASVGDASAGLGASTVVAAPYININQPTRIITYQIAVNAEQTTAEVDMVCWDLAGRVTKMLDYTMPPLSKKVIRDDELPSDIGFCWHWRIDMGGQLAVSFAMGQPGAGGVLGAAGSRTRSERQVPAVIISSTIGVIGLIAVAAAIRAPCPR